VPRPTGHAREGIQVANIFKRFWNFLTGWVLAKQSDLEAANPKVVYDQALRAQRERYRKMEESVSGLVANRNRLTDDIRTARAELDEVQAMLDQAIRDTQSADKATVENAMLVGEAIQEQEETLLKRLAELTESRDAANVRIEEYQTKLVQFQGRIKRLAEERANAIAQAQVDQETIRLNRELSGMSVDTDTEALDELRDRLGRLHALAAMTDEMRGKSLEERLEKYRLQARSTRARDRFLARVEQAKALQAGAAEQQDTLPSTEAEKADSAN
jgi:phage shock protein A